MLLRWHKLALLVLTFLGLGGAVDWAAYAASPPKINAHTPTEVTVTQGDTLTVSVVVTAEGSQAQWLSAGHTFCRALKCTVATGGADLSDWSLGLHHVTFLLSNAAGTLTLKYRIQVLQAPQGYRPVQLEPALVSSDTDVTTTLTDGMNVWALNGEGYSSAHHHLDVVTAAPVALNWQVKLRAPALATLRFGQRGSEEHTLASGGEVYLTRAASGRRALILSRGVLRSRSLGTVGPGWSLLIGDWAQIDLDAQGDVLVRCTKTEIAAGKNSSAEGGASKLGEPGFTVTVLRGNARVFVRDQAQSASSATGTATVVPQGLVLTVQKPAPKPSANPPGFGKSLTLQATLPAPGERDWLAKFVAATTPEYAAQVLDMQETQSDEAKDTRSASAAAAALGTGAPDVELSALVPLAQRPQSFAAALPLALTAVARRDFFVALEALRPFPEELQRSYNGLLCLGEAYIGVFLPELGRAALKAAAALKPEAARPHVDLGVDALTYRRFDLAQREFERALALQTADPQLAYYYLGVAYSNAHKSLAASSAFTRSLWAAEGGSTAGAPRQDIAASADSFLRSTQADEWLALHFAANAFADPNVLRSDSLALSTVGDGSIKARSSAGYEAVFGLQLRPVREETLQVSTGIELRTKDYLQATLRSLATQEEKLDLDLGFHFGGAAGEPAVIIGVQSYLASASVGALRVADEVGAELSAEAPRFSRLRLSYGTMLASDPFPGANKILDPILWEVVPTSDRSGRWTQYRLAGAPLQLPHWRLDLALALNSFMHRSALDHGDDFSEQNLDAALTAVISLRQEVALSAAMGKRSFAAASDGRRDKLQKYGLAWRWRLTPTLLQHLSVDKEAQGSSREVNTYHRILYSYGLDLRF